MKILIILSLLCISCMGSQCLPEREQIAYRLMQDFAKNKQNREMHAIGFGIFGDKINNKLGVLDIHFDYNAELSIDKARVLGIQLADSFIEFINNNEELAPHITKFPITLQQISITISGNCGDDPKQIRSVIVFRGELAYYNNILGPPNFGFMFDETYEEALRNLKTP